MNFHIMSYVQSLSFLSHKCLCLLFALVMSSLSGTAIAENSPSLFPSRVAAESKPNIIALYGPPGSGRAKIAIKLHQRFNIPTVSFTELLALALHDDSEAGQRAREYMSVGGEIPLDLFWMLIEQRMKEPDCAQGCLWEGIPWTLEQAKMAKDNFSHKFEFLVFSINASDDWLAQRVEGRIFCSSCGRVYHTPHSLPKKEGVCDICGHSLQRRTEDSPETIHSRVQAYQENITPVLAFWEQEKLLKNVSGNRPLDEIFSDIIDIILSSKHKKD